MEHKPQDWAEKILAECIGEELPPCQAACPLDIRVREKLTLMKQGNLAEALDVVLERCPFPGILGRICHHPCETACTRTRVEEPIAIAPLKRYLADLHREAVFRVSSGPERPEQVAVVGGGPAGLMCAYELRKMGYPVTIFEAEDALGGALHLYIPPYRLPRQVLDHETSLVKKLGAEVRLNTRIGRDVSWDDLRRRFQAIFVATGAHQSLPLRVPGEELEGVIAALSFLKAVNKREPVPMGREVAVIGGGNVAVDAARQARRLGSDRVTIICLETLDEMPALPLEVNEARAEGIEFLHRWGVKRLLGEDGKVAGLELKVVVQVFDDQGRFAPTYDETSLSNRPADMVITAVGLTAACDYLTTDNPPLPRPAASKWTTRPWVLSVPEFSPVEI